MTTDVIKVQIIGDMEYVQNSLDQIEQDATDAKQAATDAQNFLAQMKALPADFEILNQGNSLGDGNVDSINFKGAGVTASKLQDGVYEVTITGGGGGGTSSDTAENIRDKLESLNAGKRLDVDHLDESLTRRFVTPDQVDKINKSVESDAVSPADFHVAVWNGGKLEAGGKLVDYSVKDVYFDGNDITFDFNDGTKVSLKDAKLLLKGDTGAAGPAGQTGPQGAKGDKGDAPFTSVNVTTLVPGSPSKATISNGVLDLSIALPQTSPGARAITKFAGIFQDQTTLKNFITNPQVGEQAILLFPSESYWEYKSSGWEKLDDVSNIHSLYLGQYATQSELDNVHPSPDEGSLAIVGKTFKYYDSGQWAIYTNPSIVALAAKTQQLSGSIGTLTGYIQQHTNQIDALNTDVKDLQNSAYEGITVQDSEGNNLDQIKGLNFDGATVSDDNLTDIAQVKIESKITVANGQESSSKSATGNALIFEGATITVDPNDTNVIRIVTGRTDGPSFDPTMFESAVDHGYAPDDQGIKSSKTTDGWWVFKDFPSIGSRPIDSQGDLTVFRNTINHSDPNKQHSVIMAFGQDDDNKNAVWVMYRDRQTWGNWLKVGDAHQADVDAIQADITKLKSADATMTGKVANLETVVGNVYAPTQSAFENAVNALIAAALKNYQPKPGGHTGEVYPRMYAKFSSLGIPVNLDASVTSVTGEVVLSRGGTVGKRISILVENDNGQAEKISTFSIDKSMPVILNSAETTIDGVRYKVFYTTGTYTETTMHIKMNLG